MDNDQIKSQIENAKRAFVANKERSQEASLAELDREDPQIQEDIMTRLRGLMDEAAQSKTGSASDPIITGHSPQKVGPSPFGRRTELTFLHLNNLESDRKCKTK